MKGLLVITLLAVANTIPVMSYSIGPVAAQTRQDRDEDRRRLDEDERRYERQRSRSGKGETQRRERQDCQNLQADGGRDTFCCNTFKLACRGTNR